MFAFTHLIFQEYLAAVELLSLGRIEWLTDQYTVDRWHDVIVLAAGLPGAPVEEMIWRLLDSDIGDTGLFLADILSRAQNGTDLLFVAIHVASGKVAGATRYLNIMPKDRGLEIGGTWYGTEYQRTTVNTECKYLLLTHAFEKLGCIRVQLKTDLTNVRSQKAIERIGAKREGILRNHMILPSGQFRDSVFYSILDSEWPEVKKWLGELIVW